MKKIMPIALLLLYATLAQAQINTNRKVKPLKWLTGTWTMKTKIGYLHESWQYLNDSTLQQKSILVKTSGDTIPQETVELVYRNKQMFFLSTVAAQNEGKPVSFKITTLNDTSFVAENPKHDFPQKITYTLQTKKTILATIEGTLKGKFIKRGFNFAKQ